jgi:tetratricopeptide (TPR) repeat protein
MGDLTNAVVALDRTLQLEPGYQPARLLLGETALLLGRPELARLMFEAALSWDARLAPALFGRGRTALALHDYDTAIEYLHRALDADRTASAVHYPLALAYRDIGKTPSANAQLLARGPGLPRVPDPWLDEVERLRAHMRAGEP